MLLYNIQNNANGQIYILLNLLIKLKLILIYLYCLAARVLYLCEMIMINII